MRILLNHPFGAVFLESIYMQDKFICGDIR